MPSFTVVLDVEVLVIGLAVRVVFRNVIGYSLVILGALLSVPGIPGPGNAIILLGLALADWPGKQRFFRWLRSFHWFEVVDGWIHRKFGFRMPEHSPTNSPAKNHEQK
ncbi:MAG: hypothetical protein U1D30_07665 [Planctomycetota bacterium]